ncbi:hypothetical protein ACQKI9_10775, partial [Achromobacter xylosoxidans]
MIGWKPVGRCCGLPAFCFLLAGVVLRRSAGAARGGRGAPTIAVHKAIDSAEPGDVIVVDAGGDMSNA